MDTVSKSKVYKYLRQRLIDGTYLPGSRLSAAGLAREIGTSHIPVREALSRLQSEGLVEQKPKRGAFVRRLRRRELVELIEFRKVIECNAVAQAAQRITDKELVELGKHIDIMRKLWVKRDKSGLETERKRLDWLGRIVPADMGFHMGILHAAGNQYAIKALGEANVMTRMFGRRSDVPADWDDRSNQWNNFEVHVEILQALRQHDPKAARRAMAMHMKRAGNNALNRFDWLNDQGNLRMPSAEELPESLVDEISEMEHGKKKQ
ncbi:MAG: GntR family transcriptional regulator [Pirellulales bacterium]|nr:GntR family transcriptional regulator [Pirellulales bacterium]